MASTTFTNGSTLSDDGWFNAADQVIYEQHGVGKTTVASATTPDIFAVTIGHFIDYTGTATCTGFVAAVSAGSERVLYCAGACLFTAGANLLIEGIPSGTTITLAAGAIVRVYANTTTQFKLTYSLSGSFTAAGTGFSANGSATAYYNVVNGMVTVSLQGTNTGTSNATTYTITGWPACIQPVAGHQQKFSNLLALDNNAYVYTVIATLETTTMTLYTTPIGAGWTASSTKGIYPQTLTYQLY